MKYLNLAQLLEYSKQLQPPLQTTPQNSKADSLDTLIEDKARYLASILCQILCDIEQRKGLSQHVITDATKHYCYLKTKLYELDAWEFGRNRTIEARRSKIERQLDDLNHEIRQEQVQCWQDMAQLKKEFRTWFKQYCDVAQRSKIILPEKSLNEIQKGNGR